MGATELPHGFRSLRELILLASGPVGPSAPRGRGVTRRGSSRRRWVRLRGAELAGQTWVRSPSCGWGRTRAAVALRVRGRSRGRFVPAALRVDASIERGGGWRARGALGAAWPRRHTARFFRVSGGAAPWGRAGGADVGALPFARLGKRTGGGALRVRGRSRGRFVPAALRVDASIERGGGWRARGALGAAWPRRHTARFFASKVGAAPWGRAGGADVGALPFVRLGENAGCGGASSAGAVAWSLRPRGASGRRVDRTRRGLAGPWGPRRRVAAASHGAVLPSQRGGGSVGPSWRGRRGCAPLRAAGGEHGLRWRFECGGGRVVASSPRRFGATRRSGSARRSCHASG